MQILGFREYLVDREGNLVSSTGRVAFGAGGTKPPAAEGRRWEREYGGYADNMLTADARKKGYVVGRVVPHS
jgi:hypothetical protein